jgi:guanylate kinase
MGKYKIVALFGKSGSGKDTVLKALCKNQSTYNRIISSTTRPPREGEVDGKDYYFLDNIAFAEKILNGSFIEATGFKNWFYGTDISSLDASRINIGVFNINAIECLKEDSNLEVYPILIEAKDSIRLKRILSREEDPDCEEICRRFLADKKDFSNIPFEYSVFENQTSTITVSILNNYIEGAIRQLIITNFHIFIYP